MRDRTVSAASGEWKDYEADAGEIERIADGLEIEIFKFAEVTYEENNGRIFK